MIGRVELSQEYKQNVKKQPVSRLDKILHTIKITMVSTLGVHCDVKIDNISILNLSVVGNTMADNFVDRSAYRFWEVVIVKRTGINPPFNTGLMNDPINFICGDANPKSLSGNVKNLPSHGTCVAETILCIKLLGTINADRIVARPIPLLRVGHTGNMISIVRPTDRGWHRPSWTEHGRPQRSGEGERLRPFRRGELHFLRSIQCTSNAIGRSFAMRTG
mmetsp:Transcript_415/g.587  ORF Transcript_415/g.587 Transcript_415/m.587 type:complete len:219 (-) Transcript_415:484-1140(-)